MTGADLNISFSDSSRGTSPAMTLAVCELCYLSGNTYATTLLYDENTALAD